MVSQIDEAYPQSRLAEELYSCHLGTPNSSTNGEVATDQRIIPFQNLHGGPPHFRTISPKRVSDKRERAPRK